MVIPVCVNCQSPVNIVSDPKGGIEIIHYYCPNCRHTAASFLLGYSRQIDRETSAPPTVAREFIHRARFFGEDNRHYQLRAKMQGLKELRTKAADGGGPHHSPSDPADAE
jgi:hypothetical protein